MRYNIFIVFLALVIQGCASNTKGLGHGYRLSYYTEDMSRASGAWEGTAHYTALFYHSQRLGACGWVSIAPSGKFALFEANGKLFLFDASSSQTRDVTDGSFALPNIANWLEAESAVDVTYSGQRNSSRISLPK